MHILKKKNNIIMKKKKKKKKKKGFLLTRLIKLFQCLNPCFRTYAIE